MGMQEDTRRDVKQQRPVGSMIEVRVTRHEAYGMFVDIGLECEEMIHVVEIKEEGRATIR